jgi:hypothetical protein
MRFRLTYEGPLKASQRDPQDGQRDRMAEHKQTIRKRFHAQLKQLWKTNKFLSEYRVDPAPQADVCAAENCGLAAPGDLRPSCGDPFFVGPTPTGLRLAGLD